MSIRTPESRIEKAIDEEKEHRWSAAAQIFLELAYHFKDQRNYDRAAEFFMRAAVAAERDEDWRKIGHVWVECGSALECRHERPVTDLVESINHTNHFFPTLDRYAWERFPLSEKIGRAFRNAAYHLEKCGSNQTAYIQYRKSADAFKDGAIFAEASRTYYHSLLSFIDQHGELDPDTFAAFEEVNDILIQQSGRLYTKRRQLYYRSLAARLTQMGNYNDSSKLYCKECEISRWLAKDDKRYLRWVGFTFWKYTSYYGNSFWLWGAWVFVLFVLFFPLLFVYSSFLMWQEPSREPIWFDYVYFSLATVTTAPDPSFLPNLLGKYILTIESVIGFLMLGSLLVLMAKKFIR